MAGDSWLRRWARKLLHAVFWWRAKEDTHSQSNEPPVGSPGTAESKPDPKVLYVDFWQGSSFNAPEQERRSFGARRWVIATAVAVAAVVMVGAGGYFVYSEATPPSTSETIATSENESRIKMLEDGSVISLGANSQVHLDLQERERRLHLVKGRVDIAATRNMKRPFVVETRLARASTIGATFQVTDDINVIVEVHDGEVDVSAPGKPAMTVRKGNRYRVYEKRIAVAYARGRDASRSIRKMTVTTAGSPTADRLVNPAA